MARFHKNREYFLNASKTASLVKGEITAGLQLLNSIRQPVITIFGSHRARQQGAYCRHARRTARTLGRAGYAILTGGGPGIMQAANMGVYQAGGVSIGLRPELLAQERVAGNFYTHHRSFHFLFVRRFIMTIKSQALVFYPGGFGTLNELFESLMLMQTGIVDRVPIICVRKAFWADLFAWLERNPLQKRFLVHDRRDLQLFHFVDEAEEILSIVREK